MDDDQDIGNTELEVLFTRESAYTFEQQQPDKEDALLCHAWVDKVRGYVCGTQDGRIVLFKTRKSFEAQSGGLCMGAHMGTVTSIVYDPVSELVVSASGDGSVRTWDIDPPLGEDSAVQTLVGHKGTVLGVAHVWGKWLVSWGVDSAVLVWAADPGAAQFRYTQYVLVQRISFASPGMASAGGKGHAGPWVTALAYTGTHYSGDGLLLVAVGDRGTIEVLKPTRAHALASSSRDAPPVALDVPWFERKTKWRGVHSHGIHELVFAPKESVVFSLGYDNVAKITDVTTGRPVANISHPDERRFTHCAYNRIARELYLIDESAKVFVWFIHSHAPPREHAFTAGPLTSISIDSPSHRILLTAPERLEVWRVDRAERLVEYDGHSEPINAITCAVRSSMLPQGPVALVDPSHAHLSEVLVTAGQDNMIFVWSVIDMSIVTELREYESEITALVYNPDVDVLVSGHESGEMTVWNMDSGGGVRVQAHTNAITTFALAARTMAASSTKTYLVSGSYDGMVSVWDIPRIVRTKVAQPITTFAAEVDEVLVMAYTVHGCLVTGGNDPPLKVWSFDGSLLAKMDNHAHSAPVNALATDGDYLISGSMDGSIRVWDIVHYMWVRTIVDAHPVPLTALLLIPDTHVLVSADADGTLCVWDYANVKLSGADSYVSAASSVHLAVPPTVAPGLTSSISFVGPSTALASGPPAPHSAALAGAAMKRGTGATAPSLSTGTAQPVLSVSHKTAIMGLQYVDIRREVAAATENGTIFLVQVGPTLDAVAGIAPLSAAAPPRARRFAASSSSSASLAPEPFHPDSVGSILESYYLRDLDKDTVPSHVHRLDALRSSRAQAQAHLDRIRSHHPTPTTDSEATNTDVGASFLTPAFTL